VPTLVLHGRDDEVVPLATGRVIAAGIPDAQFVQLESRNHILLEDEPAWERFKAEVLAFTGRDAAAAEDGAPFDALSERERQILALVAEGRNNIDIGKTLFISDKTVRNHVTRIFEKLGVSSRAQAIVLAHERGFRARR
jgi:DNA-binding NarL/FixJ family response regulator